MKKNGSLHIILGCMFSGKTSELLNRYDRYTIGNKKCLLIKYKGDIRYDSKCVVTHNNFKVTAHVCEYLCNVDSIINEYDVIFIDEIQFYKDAFIFCEKWTLLDHKIVHVCGLNGTFERKPFKIINKLIPIADSLVFKTAICRETSKDGIYSKRLTCDNNEEVIGGSDIYSAADRATYFNDKKILEQYVENLQKMFTEIKNKYNIETNCKDFLK